MSNSIFELKGGDSVISRMMNVYGFTMKKELQDYLGLGNGTVSTWSTREFFPGKEVIQIVLETGVSLKWLATGEGKMYGDSADNKREYLVLDTFKLNNGTLNPIDSVSVERAFFDIQISDGIIVDYDNKKIVVERKFENAINGEWLINIDGTYSISKVTKLPESKWRVDDVDWPEDDVEFLGRVITVIEIR